MNNRQYTPEQIQQAEQELQRRQSARIEQERRQTMNEIMEHELKKNSLFDKYGLSGTPEDVRNVSGGIMQGLKTAAQPFASIINKVRNPGSQPGPVNLFESKPGSSLQEMLAKNPQSLAEQEGDQMPSFDPYKQAGVKEDPSWTTKAGLEQKGGEFAPDIYALGHLATRIPGLIAGIPNALREGLNIFRPRATERRFAERNIEEMQNEFLQGRNAQQDAYALPIRRYGNTRVTNNPDHFFNFDEATMRAMGPESRRLYDAFLAEPNFNNLHAFQSSLGSDIGLKVRTAPYKAQSLSRARQQAHDRIDDFFRNQNDAEAYYYYQHGRNLTRDVVEPFNVTQGTRSIVGRLATNVNLKDLEGRLKTALERGTVRLDRVGDIERQFGGVPQNHYLRELMERIQDQKNIVAQRERLQKVLGKTAKYGGILTGLGYTGKEIAKSLRP